MPIHPGGSLVARADLPAFAGPGRRHPTDHPTGTAGALARVMTTADNPAGLVIPDFQALVEAVGAQAPLRNGWLHGERHWQTVATIGEVLARETPGADPAVALLFGVLHDCRRIDDGGDLGHGRRAAAYALGLNGSLFHLEESRLERLLTALAYHVDGQVSDDPTVGVCWDADRLHLWRLEIEPDPALLSTAAGRARIAWARDLADLRTDWPSVYARFEPLA